MAFSEAPVMCKGGLPDCEAICAPMAESGLITRSMGRRDSDSSPIISLVNFCPETIPLNMRIVEPELPQSSATAGVVSDGPWPCTSIASSFRSQATPNERMQASVLAQSAPVE
jgi:hypothetical protein